MCSGLTSSTRLSSNNTSQETHNVFRPHILFKSLILQHQPGDPQCVQGSHPLQVSHLTTPARRPAMCSGLTSSSSLSSNNTSQETCNVFRPHILYKTLILQHQPGDLQCVQGSHPLQVSHLTTPARRPAMCSGLTSSSSLSSNNTSQETRNVFRPHILYKSLI